jgi:TatD DNase family protein
MLVDTHCHLDMLPRWLEPPLQGDAAHAEIASVLERARARGVGPVLNPGVTWAELPGVLEVAERHPDVWAAAGIHPHEAETWLDGSRERLRAIAIHRRVMAIGETGLDYYYESASREAQIRAFREQLALARELDLPVIVHTRDAEADTLDMLPEAGPAGGVLHCFTGTAELAGAAVARGFMVSFSGIVAFKKSQDLRDVARQVPLSHTLVETDAPFLAPPPHRGKRNEPTWVVHVAEALAEVHGVDLETLARITTENARRLFRFEERPLGAAR